MKFITSSEENEMQTVIQNGKAELLDTFEKGFQTQEDTLDIFMDSVDHCTLNGFDDDKIIWNAAAFINIVSLDLKHIVADLLLSEGNWKKRVHARHASMLIYESTIDLFSLMGKDFKHIIRKLSNYESIESQLKEVRQQMNQFKTTHEKTLNEIRNVATAHRDQNVKLQFDTITQLSWFAVYKQAKELDEILNKLGPILQEIINRSIEELDKGSKRI
ncbi:hypothetical protein [Pedobacter hiemivivus]|uniref:Uncharacterized protein n=1 Tax=Pedobacter hiemivivus TaxID=2530454 RepID=A0A4R0NGG9_9SPHI|nr:hypothetical protein [Pedobacter hiemivivus]TCC99535.1 hypothetical protein EZ444_02340 [Pedobacter hiemivivus]